MCTQLCPALCDPMDCSLPGSSVHGIFQAILWGIAISFSRGYSQPWDQTRVSCIAGRVLKGSDPKLQIKCYHNPFLRLIHQLVQRTQIKFTYQITGLSQRILKDMNEQPDEQTHRGRRSGRAVNTGASGPEELRVCLFLTSFLLTNWVLQTLPNLLCF